MAKDYELKITKTDGHVVRFDGFSKEVRSLSLTLKTFDDLAGALKAYYQKQLEVRESSLRGWNWGQVDFQGSNLAFSVANKVAFEVPLTEVANTSMAAKNEVMIEFAPPDIKNPDGRPVKIKVRLSFFIDSRFRKMSWLKCDSLFQAWQLQTRLQPMMEQRDSRTLLKCPMKCK